MTNGSTDQTPRELGRIARLTAIGTAACVGVSVLLTYLLLFSETMSPLSRSLLLAILVPALIAAPLLTYIGLKQRELRALTRHLNRLTTYDHTTGLMNGTALEAIVERRVSAGQDADHGGFLVVRVDNLSEINLRHGFRHGDEALRLVAARIRGSVRASDTVGRLGAAEFGVFLPGASDANAYDIGERIRAAIADISFAPDGEETLIRASTGGVVFDDELGFGEMFRDAEQQLARGGGGLALALATRGRTPRPIAH